MRARPIILSACALALGLAAFTALRPSSSNGALPAAQAATAPGADAHTLTFGGSGSVDLHPDTATVELTTVGDASSSSDALNDTSQKMQAVIAAVKGLNIAADDLQTGDVSTYQDWDAPHLWHASQTLTVTLHDVSQAGAVIAAGNTAGADQVSGPDYSLSDQRDAYNTALRQAIADARQKADVVAQAMGGSVAGVISVSENNDSPVTPMYAMAKASAGADSTVAPPTEQGTLSVSAGVTVVFSYAG
jgi:uncharacterized protein YggE